MVGGVFKWNNEHRRPVTLIFHTIHRELEVRHLVYLVKLCFEMGV